MSSDSDSNSDQGDGMNELQELILESEVEGNKEQQTPQMKNDTKETKTKKINKEPQECIQSEEEIQLKKLIFGDREGLIKNLSEAVGECVDHDTDKSSHKAAQRKPAWIDDDDENLLVSNIKRQKVDKLYKEYLEREFKRVTAQPKWADLDRKDTNSDSDDEILRTVGFLAKPNLSELPPKNISVKILKDLNRGTYAEGSITSIQFHPTSTAALVSGSLGIATIYSVDGKRNEKLHSIRFEKFPIICARILHCGTKAIFGSVRRTYYTYDLLRAQELLNFLPKHITTLSNFEISPSDQWMAVAGRFGEMHLFDAKSNEIIYTFAQNDPVTGIKFSKDSKSIITNCKGNTVSIFDIRQQRLQHSFIDEGCINGSVIDISPNSRMLATGSMEGVANVYDFEKVFNNSNPKPAKSIMNLTTAISDLKFNHNSEILAMCSREVPSAVKLVHFPSGTVFANFPRFNQPIKGIQTIEFSPSSGYLALGNVIRNVSLIRLNHYKNY